MGPVLGMSKALVINVEQRTRSTRKGSRDESFTRGFSQRLFLARISLRNVNKLASSCTTVQDKTGMKGCSE